MFDEDEWSDGEDAQVVPETVPTSNTRRKLKAVGKKSLLRTLQTLASIPEWKHEDHIQDSDSDTTLSPNKKKRRKKRRKHGATSGEQQENVEDSAKEPALKKTKKNRKCEGLKAENASAKETKVEKVTDCEVNKPQNSDKLSRQQWKNKMKNKRKCKNKYRHNKSEDGESRSADQTELKKNVKMDSHRNNSSLGSRQAPSQRKERENTETPVSQSKDKNNQSSMEIKDEETQISCNKVKLELIKENNLKRGKLKKFLQSQAADQHQSPTESRDELLQSEEKEATPTKASSFRSRMEQRLESARFRYINEVLYSTSSGEAKRMFRQDPQAFWIYHKGYTAQVEQWPSNPVDSIITDIKKKSSSLVVADFGCGDCKIARSVKNKVHSFDLAATCELVTVCDMAHVPLEDSSVDVAVFCLSLMGTNLTDFVAEANRVLKMGGILKIAEVASRFDNLRSFITALSRLGFKMESKNTDNTHFYSFEFVKMQNVLGSAKKLGLQLKPCLYKKR